MESKKNEFIETESRLMVVRGQGGEGMGESGKRVQTSSYEMSKFWGSNV